MPALVPVALYYAATALGLGTLVAGAISLGAALAYGDRARRKANRAAQAAWEAGLRDRTTLVRSAELPRSVTYGRVQISGELVYGKSIGELQDRLLLVIALRSGHALDAVEEVFFGERSLGTLDGNGYPTAAPFAVTRSDVANSQTVAASGSATTVVTLPSTPVGGAVDAFLTTSTGDSGYTSVRLGVSLAGAVLTINSVSEIGTPLDAGTPISVSWTTTRAEVFIRCKTYLGADDQVADTDAIADSGGEWTSAHRGRGVPALYLWLNYNPDVFPSGVENIKCTVRGKRIYDPRKDSTNGGSGSHRANNAATWEYSRNPALIARDYLTSSLGFGCPSSEIDDVMVAAAANVCDEVLQINSIPEFELRYTCDTDLSTENPRDDNLQVILASMAGSAVYSQGKWRILAGAYTSPAVTLDETALAGTEPISLQARVPRASLFNAVKGVYVSPLNKWQPTDYPIVVNSTYETQDGSERMVADLPLPATTSSYAAQRLAKIELERSRQALTVRAAFNFKAYRVSAGDIVGLTIARYGFSAKAFRVIDREFDFGRGIVLTLREEAAGVYSWNSGEATTVDLAPNTDLPDAFGVPAMGALSLASGTAHLLRQVDGTVVTRIYVSWAALTDARVTQGGAIEVEWQSADALVWNALPPLPGDAASVYVVPVTEGQFYQVRARARTGVGVRSQWSTSTWHQAVGKTSSPGLPESLAVTTAPDGTRVISWDWGTRVKPSDLKGVRLRYGLGSSLAWNALQPLDSDGGFFTASPVETVRLESGAYTFGLKTEDYSGNLSLDALLVNVTLAAGPRGATILTSDQAALGWPGTKTSCAVVGGVLEATDSGGTWDSLTTWSAFTRWNRTPASPITYQTPTLDAGALKLLKVVASVSAAGTLTIEEQHSDDNSTFSAWAAVVSTFVTTRYVRVRITCTASGGSPVPAINALTVTLEGPAAAVSDLQDTSSVDKGATLVRYLQAGTGAVARPLSALLQDRINVKEFKAAGATDDTAALQAAVTEAQARGGATIYLPAGVYTVSSQIAITGKGVRIVGDGMYATTIVKSGTSSDVFGFNNAACDLCEVTDLRITKGASTHTSGVVFKLNTAGALGIEIRRVLVEDVYSVLESKPGTLGVNDVIVADCEWLRIEKYGIYAEYALNWKLRQIVIQMNGTATGTAGVVIGSSSEGWGGDSVYVLGGEHSWYFANTLAGTSPKEHTFIHCIGDGGRVTCFYMAGLRRSKFLSCWGSSQVAAARGVVFDGTDCFGIQWLGGSLVNMAADAMQIVNGAARITVAHSIFSNWGLDTANTHYGIQVGHNASTTFRIVDNEFSDDADLSGNGCWIGVGVGAGTYPKYTIVGNHGNGLSSSVVSDGGTASVGKTVANNH